MSDEIGTGDGDVFVRWRYRLMTAAQRIVGDREDAEDLVQEAWLRWHTVDRSSILDPPAFLYRMVTRMAIDRLRHRRTHPGVALDDLPGDHADPAPNPADEAEAADAVARSLRLLLETVSPIQRATVLLHNVFGFTYAEIAIITGRTEHAVRQLAYRARRQLQDPRPLHRTTTEDHRAALDRFRQAAAVGTDLAAYGRACAVGN